MIWMRAFLQDFILIAQFISQRYQACHILSDIFTAINNACCQNWNPSPIPRKYQKHGSNVFDNLWCFIKDAKLEIKRQNLGTRSHPSLKFFFLKILAWSIIHLRCTPEFYHCHAEIQIPYKGSASRHCSFKAIQSDVGSFEIRCWIEGKNCRWVEIWSSLCNHPNWFWRPLERRWTPHLILFFLVSFVTLYLNVQRPYKLLQIRCFKITIFRFQVHTVKSLLMKSLHDSHTLRQLIIFHKVGWHFFRNPKLRVLILKCCLWDQVCKTPRCQTKEASDLPQYKKFQELIQILNLRELSLLSPCNTHLLLKSVDHSK